MLSVIGEFLRLGALLALVMFLLYGAFYIRRNQKIRLLTRNVFGRFRL